MERFHREYGVTFGAEAALAAPRKDQVASEFAVRFPIQPTLIHTREKQLMESAPDLAMLSGT
jgi:hypothetical protein|tara:strand:- start:619 stop:804 length:186 start_codon:yes stop_codon:yes gene_type:complete